MNWKMIIVGAGILILWGVVGALAGVGGGQGPLSFMPMMLYVVLGLIPCWYFGQQYAVAGYIGTYVIIWLSNPALVGGA